MPPGENPERTLSARYTAPPGRTTPRPPLTFAYWGEDLPYCRARYNSSGLNERAVEIPIAEWFIDSQPLGAEGLEVGNVLAHYRPITWPVIDRYEQAATYNIDLFDHHTKVDWIVAISTLEHVRFDEPDTGRLADGPQRALEHLHRNLRPEGRMLITIPMGWHPYIDSAILEDRLPVQPTRQCTLVRQAGDPVRWVQTDKVTHHRYAASSIWAESVWVGEFAA